ncbi:MAG: hypothetical protein ACK55Z_15995, partial [bacterium]
YLLYPYSTLYTLELFLLCPEIYVSVTDSEEFCSFSFFWQFLESFPITVKTVQRLVSATPAKGNIQGKYKIKELQYKIVSVIKSYMLMDSAAF